MPEKKIGQTKIYIIIGLCLVLVAVVYFRFVHQKVSFKADQAASTASIDQSEIPQVDIQSPQNAPGSKWRDNEILSTVIRDIFAPLQSPKKAETQSAGKKSPRAVPSLKLRGTIVGGGRPVAIINDKFLHRGDRIGDYQVVRIGKKEVLLEAGNDKIELGMVKNE